MIYRLQGEEFCVEYDDDGVCILHPRWSLMGSGRTLQDAAEDLHDECRRLAGIMQHWSDLHMDSDTTAMRTFVSRVA